MFLYCTGILSNGFQTLLIFLNKRIMYYVRLNYLIKLNNSFKCCKLNTAAKVRAFRHGTYIDEKYTISFVL